MAVANPVTAQGRQFAFRLVVIQFLVTVIFSLFGGVFFGVEHALGAFAGGCISVIPNAVFAALAFAHGGARSAKTVVRSFYRGEATKIFLTAVLFALVLKYAEVGLLSLYITFTAALMVHWIAPVFLQQKQLG